MANLSKSRTLFAFTSPRTIEKIVPEIRLLVENFTGQKWTANSGLQEDFFNILFDSEFYLATTRPADPALAARDRITRAPKALGFVDLKPTIALTSPGKRLLSGIRTDEVITRQLLKFQLPSPFHTDKAGRYSIKPYLELLRFVDVLGGVTKTEIAIFCLQLTHFNDFDDICDKIRRFRVLRTNHKGNRKQFVLDTFHREILDIFSAEIQAGNTGTRESASTTLANFVKTKRANMMDYADAFIRYLRATGLVTIDARQARMIVSRFRTREVRYILDNIQRAPIKPRSEKEYKTYLFDATLPVLFNDNRERLEAKIQEIKPAYRTDGLKLEELKDALEEIEVSTKLQNLKMTQDSLRTAAERGDVEKVYEKILNKELPDAPLFFEWNIWRTLSMLNYGQIVGNFTTDIDGVPISVASAKKADIMCSYENFEMIVEVTMSSGHKQYEMEGEPVARHYGDLTRSTTKNSYCLFVAPNVSGGTLAHFFILNRTAVAFYGGKARIVPMDLAVFRKLADVGLDGSFSKTSDLERFLQKACDSAHTAKDENSWKDEIVKMANTWV